MLVGSEGRGEHGLALAHLAVERDLFMNCGISIGFAGHADPLLAILGVRSFEHLLINFKASCFYFEGRGREAQEYKIQAPDLRPINIKG